MTGDSGTALSEAALQAALRDIRLPPDAPGGALADLAAAIAFGCVLALAMGAVLRALGMRRARHHPGDALNARLDALRTLPEPDQRVALLHLLKAHAPERFAALRGQLYRVGGGLDAAALRAELDRHV